MARKRKLTTVGNSFALVIDKQICRLLRLNADTEFAMHLDGERIVFEPIRRDEPPRRIDRVAVHRMMRTLLAGGLSPEAFKKLHPTRVPLFAFMGQLTISDDIDPVVVKRIEMCVERRRAVRESWDVTVEAVLAEIPNVADGAANANAHHGATSTAIAAARPGAPVETPTAQRARAFVRSVLGTSGPAEGD